MGIHIRPADLQEDRELIISTLLRHLTAGSDQRRYEWLYLQNPEGSARAWLAVDDASGETVGVSAAFPRRFKINGVDRGGWVLGDFCVSGEYRSLGPALKLQKATLEAIDAGETRVCFDFPGQQMTAIYKRMGIAPHTELVRFSKLLRVNNKVEAAVGRNYVSAAMSWVLNSGLRLSRSFSATSKWQFAMHEGQCGEEFTAVGEASDQGLAAYRRKSAEFVNWRYLEHPLLSYRILAARRNQRLEGYLVFHIENNIAEVAELCVESDGLMTALLNELANRLTRTSAGSINLFLTRDDPRRLLVEKSGFWARESCPVMVCGPRLAAGTAAGLKWSLMRGDRDS